MVIIHCYLSVFLVDCAELTVRVRGMKTNVVYF